MVATTGTIYVESRLDHGTTFTVMLPRLVTPDEGEVGTDAEDRASRHAPPFAAAAERTVALRSTTRRRGLFQPTPPRRVTRACLPCLLPG